MKNICLALMATLLICSSCGSDDDTTTGNIVELRHDGANADSPTLEIGTHVMGSRFSANELATHNGKTLDAIEFYLVEVPPTCQVVIYEGGSVDIPGTEIYRQTINSLNANSWNIHNLSTPIEVGGEDLWLCIQVTHTSLIRSVGCDQGPAVNDGDWISSDFSPEWKTFRTHTANVSDINWNIRGDLSE